MKLISMKLMHVQRALPAVLMLGLAPGALGIALDVCDSCKTGRLCKPHAEEEEQLLGELRERLESTDPGERIDALGEVAELTYEHEGAPSKEVAELLAAALEDDRLEVRTKAMELLSEDQHPEIAVRATVEVLDGFRKGMWSLVGDLIDGGRRGTHQEAMEYIETCVRQAGDLRDDRIAKSLSRLLPAFPEEMQGQPVTIEATRSLLDLGTRDSYGAVIDQLESLQPGQRLRNLHGLLEDFAHDQELEPERIPVYGPEVAREWAKLARKLDLKSKLGKWKGHPPAYYRDED